MKLFRLVKILSIRNIMLHVRIFYKISHILFNLCLIIIIFFIAAQIESRTSEIVELWQTLVAATEKKGSKLQEASQQQQFNRTVEDVELWLSEIEGQLLSEDYGKVCFHMKFLNNLFFT